MRLPMSCSVMKYSTTRLSKMTVTTVPPTHPLARRHAGLAVPSTTAELHQSVSPQYQRRADHSPRISDDDETLHILTLLTDERHHETMTALRKRWFPPQLLKVDAHITLFHALPESQLPRMKEDIAAIAAQTMPFEIGFGRKDVFEMRRGAGIHISNHDDGRRKAEALRRRLRDRWQAFLSDQDRQEKWRGHYTIMNKQDDKELVQQCVAHLKNGHAESRGRVEGLSLWRYDRGWWTLCENFRLSP